MGVWGYGSSIATGVGVVMRGYGKERREEGMLWGRWVGEWDGDEREAGERERREDGGMRMDSNVYTIASVGNVTVDYHYS